MFGWSHACVCFDANLFVFCAHVCNTPRMRHLKATLTSNVWHTWLFRLHICLFAITSIQRKSTRLCVCRCYCYLCLIQCRCIAASVVMMTRIRVIIRTFVWYRYKFVHTSSHARLSYLRECVFVDEFVVNFYEYINSRTHVFLITHAYVCIWAHVLFIFFDRVYFIHMRVFDSTLTSECVFRCLKTQGIGSNYECICCNCWVLCVWKTCIRMFDLPTCSSLFVTFMWAVYDTMYVTKTGWWTN